MLSDSNRKLMNHYNESHYAKAKLRRPKFGVPWRTLAKLKFSRAALMYELAGRSYVMVAYVNTTGRKYARVGATSSALLV